jgi:hypothetical protein
MLTEVRGRGKGFSMAPPGEEVLYDLHQPVAAFTASQDHNVLRLEIVIPGRN